MLDRTLSPIRVASVPAGHVYVRHLAPPAGEAQPTGESQVRRLADPPTGRAGAAPEAWWPPAMLERDWVIEHADDFDVMHVHFGFDAVAPQELERWAQTLRDLGKPLIVTAHDLRNPHHRDPGLHDEQLGVLLNHADRVITLTDRAAAVLSSKWGVAAHVIPHPHIVDETWLERPRPRHNGFVVGIHCKSLRANLDPLPVIAAVLDGAAERPDLRVRVDVHTDVMVAGLANFNRHTRDTLRGWEARGLIDLQVHDYFTDDELNAYLQGLDAAVLPYRFGTHSGWLEACRDLGTWVIAPSCGCYAGQGDCLTFELDETRFDSDSLIDALDRARTLGAAPRAGALYRREQRAAIAREHSEIYAALLGSRDSALCTSS